MSPNRGLVATTVPVASAEDRCTLLNQMLGLICQYAPHFLQNQIQNTSTSMQSIWSFIREYYRFAQSESTFMKFLDIRQEQEERPERLYYRLLSHIQDNLLCKDSKLLFEGVKVTEDEVMGPTLRRLIILNWLHVIHPGLPALLTRAFAFDLQRMTLVDLFPQICESLDAFLDELKENDTVAAQVNYTDNRSGNRRPSNSNNRFRPSFRPSFRPRFNNNNNNRSGNFNTNRAKLCWRCKSQGRPHTHAMAECDFMSRAEKNDIIASFCDADDVVLDSHGNTDVYDDQEHE